MSVWGYHDDNASRSSYVGLDMGDECFANDTYTAWDLTTGTQILAGSDVTGSGIEDWGSGWYRVWITAVSDAPLTSTCQVHLTVANGAASYQGASKIAVWFHPQFELGTYPSSPMISAGSDTTRNKDEFEWAAAQVGDSLWQGTYNMKVSPFASSTATRDNAYIFVLEDSVGGNRVNARLLADDRIRLQKYTGTFATLLTTDALVWNSRDIITLRFNAADGSLSVSGATSGDGTYTGTAWNEVFDSAPTMHLGMTHTQSGHFNGLISEPY
jgi:hypothetical protein